MENKNLQLYLPTELPDGLNLTAVWAVVRDGEVGNIVVLVYSKTNETRISPAELTIEVQPLPGMPWRVVD